MTISRAEQIDLESTPYYHIISRCVRRSYLCGKDSESGKDYSHRKAWIINRIKALSQVFAIDIAAYAIMDNHYHLVVHVDSERLQGWSDNEVIERWSSIYPRNAKPIQDIAKTAPKQPQVLKSVTEWRERLKNISWLMSCINGYMARQCNYEDDCTGRFWEGRFRSQALLDEGAVLSAMVYVDLNPVRAGIDDTPEESEFTSIQERIQSFQKQELSKPQGQLHSQPESLMMFQDLDTTARVSVPRIEFKLQDYLQLVDDTGRVLRQDKRGAIPSTVAPILERIGLSQQGWLTMVNGLESHFAFAVGHENNLLQFGNYKKARKGTRLSSRLYLKSA